MKAIATHGPQTRFASYLELCKPRVVALMVFAKTHKRVLGDVFDFVVPLPGLGMMFGRIGNFINGELWGKPTTLPWGFNFQGQVLHPSQLYEAGLEGVLLFIVLWIYARKPRPVGAVSAVFLIGYGVLRFLVEYTREPDSFLGLLALNLSMGQWLSLPMIAFGIGMLAWAYRPGRGTAQGAPAGREKPS